jgi:transposase-like protein
MKKKFHSENNLPEQVIQKLPNRCPYCEQPISYEKFRLKEGENEIECPSCRKTYIKVIPDLAGQRKKK